VRGFFMGRDGLLQGAEVKKTWESVPQDKKGVTVEEPWFRLCEC